MRMNTGEPTHATGHPGTSLPFRDLIGAYFGVEPHLSACPMSIGRV